MYKLAHMPKVSTSYRKFAVLTRIGCLPTTVWQKVVSFLPLSDQASLALSSAYLYTRLGKDYGMLAKLQLSSRCKERLKTLYRIPDMFDKRTLCAPCVQYHETDLFMPKGRLSEVTEFSSGFVKIADTDNYWRDLHNMLRVDCDNIEDVDAESKGLDGRSGWEAIVQYRYDDETDNWLANIDGLLPFHCYRTSARSSSLAFANITAINLQH